MKSGLVAHLHGRNWKKAELRPYEFLIYTAAKGEKEECGRALHTSPIRPQLKKDGAAAVFFAHLYGRK